ncbi:MAG: PEP-CTERM sorting domain-containing protein [Phycisphaeraceae bacterium]|nr:PEP-CTERM sorting domain-containing protein [Phycisphaeraceae bacterium]
MWYEANRTCLSVALAAVLFGAAGHAEADYDKTWDYKGADKGGGRTLSLTFGVDTIMKVVHTGGVEPDPTPENGYNIADSVRRAMSSWNATGSGWTLKEGAPLAGEIPVHVRMGFIDPTDPTKNEFDHPNSDTADNDGHGGGGPKNTLAFFRITGTDPADGRFATSAEIVFNPFASWGIGTNAPMREDINYDPIIVALHEIGHALRLDHTTPGGSTTIGIPRDGDVMRPMTQSGWHQTNMDAAFARNPHANDIAFAMASATNPLPTPSTVAAMLLGLGAASGRRRRGV